MNVKTFNRLLTENPDVALYVMFPSGEFVPAQFHITEVGRVKKQFVDCGGTRRDEQYCSLQVWVANDVDHRLNTSKLSKIMKAAESFIDNDSELPLMVEYGKETITQYPVSDVEVTPKGLLLVLGNKPTACLAPDKCGVKGCC